MRIVSQDETIDIPYENVMLQADCGVVWCFSKDFFQNNKKALGNYETQERAIEILKDIRKNYGFGRTRYEMPQK